jgi:oligoribonuclease NrnB/cAMP/cGMP phosphodiesterase (DHH superfamily)
LKIKLFTHTDLDGVGCTIVANHAFGAENVNVEYCDYNEIDNKVRDFVGMMQYKYVDKVFITDISVNKDMAELIDFVTLTEAEAKDKFILLDHHATAGWLNKYYWAIVSPIKVVEVPGDPHPHVNVPVIELKTSGTSMLYDYVLDNNYMPDYYDTHVFVEKVRRWDTWDWKNIHNDEEAKRLNSLLYLIGREKFVQRFSANASIEFTDGEKLLLEVEENKIKKYMEKVSQKIIPVKIENYNAGVVFAEQYISELGNDIAENNPQFDFIVIVNMGGGGISYRRRDGIDIDLGQVAKAFGGGGHQAAAGSSLYHRLDINNFAQSIFTQGG